MFVLTMSQCCLTCSVVPFFIFISSLHMRSCMMLPVNILSLNEIIKFRKLEMFHKFLM